MKVGFIGLGIMGSSMAYNVFKGGYDLIVYNRTESKTKIFREAGVPVAKTPKEVAEKSDVVILMVTDAPDVENVLFAKNGVAEGAHEGLIVVDMSTNSPEFAEKFANVLAKLKVEFLDAPVTGGDVGAREGRLTIMVGGKKEMFEKVKPIFETMGKMIIYAGPVGSGQKMKLVNQIAVALSDLAMIEAIELAKFFNLDIEQVYKVLSTGGARSFTIESYMPRLIKGDLEPGFKLSHLRKDIGYALEEAKKKKIPLFATSLTYQMLVSTENLGYGEKGIQALIKLYETLSKTQQV
ncbi:MAG: NAD(P)-dependent oxidoreductase [Nitrososphaeria archaeon]|nr:NAD(P)-dependent oxidoreductase [Conexivisphaerales archaeon]